MHPCRLCQHVVLVVRLVCFDDPWGYPVESLMPGRSKVRRQTKRPAVYPCARTVEVRFRDASAHQTCLCKRISDVSPEENPTSLKNAKLKSATGEGPDIGPTVYQGCWNRSNEIPRNWHQGQLKEQAGFFSRLTLSSAHV